jgi:capsular exopolysaccharide synthesis family protein
MATPNLITLVDPRAPAAEAYRTLRTSLLFSTVDEPVHTLVFTSPMPRSGKSTTVANLAVTLAQGDYKTILVDCDLRQPQQHAIWGVENERGLTTMMLEAGAIAEPPLQDVGLENLSVLTSGPLPPNPADLLGSRKMDEVIGVLKARAEFVLFDAPPLLAVSDAAILGSKADGVLLVLRAGQSRRDHAMRAKDLLAQVNVRIVGSVLINVRHDVAVSDYYR